MLWRHGSGGGLPSRSQGQPCTDLETGRSIGFHHFRHFAATVTLAGGVDLRMAAGRLGYLRRH